jgi:hypothetical protein
VTNWITKQLAIAASTYETRTHQYDAHREKKVTHVFFEMSWSGSGSLSSNTAYVSAPVRVQFSIIFKVHSLNDRCSISLYIRIERQPPSLCTSPTPLSTRPVFVKYVEKK